MANPVIPREVADQDIPRERDNQSRQQQNEKEKEKIITVIRGPAGAEKGGRSGAGVHGQKSVSVIAGRDEKRFFYYI